MYRSSSPYSQAPQPPRAYSPQPPIQRAYSPQPPAQPYAQQAQPYTPAPGSQITPGSVTYTTSTGPDGRVTYYPFKAVGASYQTPTGVVSGIQWVPAEATHIMPEGATRVSSEMASTWNRGYLDEDKLKEWQRDEDKRRKKEEKESAKRLREQEYRKDEQVRGYERERRKSFNAGPPGAGAPQTGFLSFPPQGGPPPTGPYQTYVDPNAGALQYPPPGSGGAYGRERRKSNAGGYDALGRQFDDLNLNREREYPEQERKISGVGRPRKYSTSAGDERPAPYGSAYVPQGAASPYGSPYTVPAASGHTAPGGRYSPNPNRPGELPYNPSGGNSVAYPGSAYSSSARGGTDPIPRSTTPYGSTAGAQSQAYPRGHIMEGHPMPPKSRPSSPMPGAAPGATPYGTAYSGYGYPEQPGKIRSHSPRPPSPRLGGASPHIPGAVLPDPAQQLLPPEGFSRQVNRSAAFAAFAMMKIQDMEEFLLASQLPSIPLVLKSHDVYPEDWNRLMSDVRLAWSGRLPVPTDGRGGQTPRRTTLVAELVDLWNTSFFFPRGVEIVLFRGRERRSGSKYGTIDRELPEDEDSDRSETESEEEDESDFEEYVNRNVNTYGRPQSFDRATFDRRRRETKEEKRRLRKEKEAKRKARAREREKTYALYVTHVPVPSASHAAGGMPGGYTPVTTTAYVPPTGGYGRHGY